jgi:excisionase family DNA binding protein
MPTMTSRLVTPDEAAHTLRVHPTTVRRLIRRGQLPAVRVGGHWRLRADDLERLVAAPTETTSVSHPLISKLDVPPSEPCFVCGLRSNGYRIDDQRQRVEGREYLALKIDLAGGDEPVSPSRILTQKEAPDGTQLMQVRDPTTGEAQTLTLIRPVVCSECVEAMAREFGMRSIPEADVAWTRPSTAPSAPSRSLPSATRPLPSLRRAPASPAR